MLVLYYLMNKDIDAFYADVWHRLLFLGQSLGSILWEFYSVNSMTHQQNCWFGKVKEVVSSPWHLICRHSYLVPNLGSGRYAMKPCIVETDLITCSNFLEATNTLRLFSWHLLITCVLLLTCFILRPHGTSELIVR
jgi:hypothetical protein